MYVLYTLYINAQCLGHIWELEMSLQNKADMSILTYKVVSVLMTKSQQKPKGKSFFKLYALNKLVLPPFDQPY